MKLWPLKRAFFDGLGFIPEGIESFKREITDLEALILDPRLNVVKAPGEFLIATPKRGFGINLKVPSNIGHDKENIPQLLLHVGLITKGHRLLEFIDLFMEFLKHRAKVWPIKAMTGRSFLKLLCTHEGRKILRDGTQKAFSSDFPFFLPFCDF